MKKREKLSLGSSDNSSLLTTEPSSHSIALGQTLSELSNALAADPNAYGEYTSATEDLSRHQQENVHFIEESALEKISCPHSLKKWAAERMPALKIPYEIKNRLSPKQIEENADKHASIRLLELAEDFLQIASFCRSVQAMQIEMSPHAAGMEFLIEFMGECGRNEMRTIEDKGLNLLFKKYSRENSMRLRANVSDDYAEMQAVVLKKQIRLGLSPVD